MANGSGDVDGLIRRVAAYAAQSCRMPLPPVITDAEIDDAEQWLGLVLHPLLCRLYCEVANGGFGPDYTLLPLSGAKNSLVEQYLALTAEWEDGKRVWPLGVVPILDWGCGMYAAVDCAAAAGTVLLFEPNAGPANWAEAWFVDAWGLANWLETWLAGTGWYRQDVDKEGQSVEMVPWDAAGSRLAHVG